MTNIPSHVTIHVKSQKLFLSQLGFIISSTVLTLHFDKLPAAQSTLVMIDCFLRFVDIIDLILASVMVVEVRD